MTRHTPLPEPYTHGPFLVAHALNAGVGRGRLAGRDLHAPFHGVRTSAPVGAADAYAPRLRPQDRYSHTTALTLMGAPIPRPFDQQLHVTVTNAPGRARLREPRALGVIGHSTTIGTTMIVRGRPVSDPLSAFVEAASVLELDGLVAVGDYLVLDPRVLDPAVDRPLLPASGLLDALTTVRGGGVVLARKAAALVRHGAESPMETQLRLLLLRAGLPEPVCGYGLTDHGRRVGFFDLAWPEFRVIAEYDGDQHRISTSQYERDIARFDAASDLDWRVVRVRMGGLRVTPDATIGRVARALERAGWSKRRKRT